MEESSLDWEELEYDGEVEKGSGFGWVLSKGLNLGKNLVITGVVVSSVPIVVPPLLVVSALGFAFSVPFGFMYASYTCTEKLMSKLLPITSSPCVVEFGEGEVVGSEEKERGQLDEYMVMYQEELGDENVGVMLVMESEEGMSTVGELREDEEGLRYDDVNRSEDGLGVAELEKNEINMSEEGLATVGESGRDEEGLRYNDIIIREEELVTVTESARDEDVLLYNDIIISEEGLGTVTESAKEEEGLQYNDIITSEEGLGTVTESAREEEGLHYNDIIISEEGLGTVTESARDEEGLHYNDVIISEEGLGTVGELGNEEGLLYGDISRSEERLSTVSELENEVWRKNNVHKSEEALQTGTEFGKDDYGSQKNDVNTSEESLIVDTEFGIDQEELQKGDVNGEDTDGNRAIAAIMVVSELDVPHEEMLSDGIDQRKVSVEVIEVLQKNNVNEEGLNTGTEFGKDEEESQKDDVNMSEGSLTTEFEKDQEGLQKDSVNRGDTDGNRANAEILVMDELGAPHKDMQPGKDEEGPRKNDVKASDGLATGAGFRKGEEGLQKDDLKMGDADSYRASDAVMVTGDLDAPHIEDMQSGVSLEETGVEVNRSGIEESRETKVTDDAISQVQTIPSRVETKVTDDAISQVQTIPSMAEKNSDRSKNEVTRHEVEDTFDTKLEGQKNDVHGSKGVDTGKKRHTSAKGKKKTRKTLKRVEGDVSKAHEKDLVKPEIVSSKADVSLESVNKLDLDKNEMQLPAQDVAEEKITGVVVISKDDDKTGHFSTSIVDVDENNKNADLLESETTANEPCDQAANVSVLVPVLEVSDSKSVPVLIQHEESVELKDDSAPVEGNGVLRNKEMPGVEEIWSRIDSIRTIVGFKVARNTSYFEELKALYVFTGIEPPSLFKDPFDTAEVCDKLRFLMSVIGVK